MLTDTQLALVLSAASVVVALISFFWSIGWSVWQHRQLHKPRLTVIATNSLPVFQGGTGEWCVGVTVVNDGGVAVTLTSIKFMWRGDHKKRGFFAHWRAEQPHAMPIKLAPGDRWSGLTIHDHLRAELVNQFGIQSRFDLYVVAIDAADRNYRTTFSVLTS